MADEEDDRDSLLSPRYAVKSLSLRPLSWRIFHSSVFPKQLESVSLEIKCKVRSGWDDKIEVAGQKLNDLPFSLQISRAGQDWLDKAIEQQGLEFDDNGFSPKRLVIGSLDYYKFEKDWPGEQPKKGSIMGWIAYGSETFDRILAALTDKTPHFGLSIEVRFDERGGSAVFPTYKWSGEKSIDVLGGNLVLFSEDPDAEEPVGDPFASEQVDEHKEAIARNDQLLAAIQKLMLPLWIIAGAVIGGLLFGR